MTSADMVVNDYAHNWTSDGSSGFDLQSVVTHEVGHWIGLSHTGYGSVATMHPYNNGGTSWRTLSCDDTEAACDLYPSTGTACTADHYCACGETCINGWCDGVVSGPPAGDDDDAAPDDDDAAPDDDDAAPPVGDCSGADESLAESEPNDWDGSNDYDSLDSSGGDLTISGTISCARDWNADHDWFVVDVPCADDVQFTLDWGGGTSDLDFWVYDADGDLIVTNQDEDYSGPVMEQTTAGEQLQIVVACWSGPSVPYTFTVDWFPWGSQAGPDDDDDDGPRPGETDDDDGDDTDDPDGQDLPDGGSGDEVGDEGGEAEDPEAQPAAASPSFSCACSAGSETPDRSRSSLAAASALLLAGALTRRRARRGERKDERSGPGA
jgi:MYXO-CTERM domain-containing protein